MDLVIPLADDEGNLPPLDEWPGITGMQLSLFPLVAYLYTELMGIKRTSSDPDPETPTEGGEGEGTGGEGEGTGGGTGEGTGDGT